MEDKTHVSMNSKQSTGPQRVARGLDSTCRFGGAKYEIDARAAMFKGRKRVMERELTPPRLLLGKTLYDPNKFGF